VSFPAAPGNDTAQSQEEELVLTMTNGLVTKIERLDNITHVRKELSADEYAAIVASYYEMYYSGIRRLRAGARFGQRGYCSGVPPGDDRILCFEGSDLMAAIAAVGAC
jgi:hypothetical protein